VNSIATLPAPQIPVTVTPFKVARVELLPWATGVVNDVAGEATTMGDSLGRQSDGEVTIRNTPVASWTQPTAAKLDAAAPKTKLNATMIANAMEVFMRRHTV